VAIIDAAAHHMEVIVDDTQLSLAIGKKGQNVRLAAKLLGWKIDIKSEEEKRQEVESAMAALVSPGAPVSVLMEYGLAESVIGDLIAGGVSTIEKLGNMTPEELQELPGISETAVERIRDAVNGYYGQFEAPAEEASSGYPAEIAPSAPGEQTAAEPDVSEGAASGATGEQPAAERDVTEEAAAAAQAASETTEEGKGSDTIGDLGSNPLS